MKIKFPGIKQIARPPSISFTKDNVHLTDRAARLHFKSVYKASYETFFTKEDDYLTEDEGTTPMELNPEQEVEISVKKKKRSRQESEGSSDEEGRQEGQKDGQRLMVESLLAVRFGNLDEELSAIISQLMELSPTERTQLLLNLSREELLARFKVD